MNKLRILIGGGSGFVGTALTASLIEQGHDVTIISRESKPAHSDFNYFTSWDQNPEAGTLTWENIARDGLPPAMDAVINLAGSNIMDFKKLWTCKYKEECVLSRVSTTQLLAKAISECDLPPSVWISTSSVHFYPPSKENEYDETSSFADFYPASKPKKGNFTNWFWASQLYASIENAAVIPDPETRIRSVILRLGIVLGKGGGAYNSIHVPFFCCLGGTIGDGSQWFPYVHLKDVVRAYEFAIFEEQARGPLNVVAPSVCTNKEFTEALGKAMNRPTVLGVPDFMSMLMGKERASILFDGQHVKPSVLTSMGFAFDFPDATSCCVNLVDGAVVEKDGPSAAH